MLRDFYKELRGDEQSSTNETLNLGNTSRNANETRYVEALGID